jgi:hypothetical protein
MRAVVEDFDTKYLQVEDEERKREGRKGGFIYTSPRTVLSHHMQN